MDANWLKERLNAVRREIDGWPEWQKRQVEKEINKTPLKTPTRRRESEGKTGAPAPRKVRA
jgi:hypothetical protein